MMHLDAIRHWLTWLQQFDEEPSTWYTDENILDIQLLSSHRTEAYGFTTEHAHTRLHLDDELPFVDLLYGYEGETLKYMLVYADTDYMTVYLSSEGGSISR